DGLTDHLDRARRSRCRVLWVRGRGYVLVSPVEEIERQWCRGRGAHHLAADGDRPVVGAGEPALLERDLVAWGRFESDRHEPGAPVDHEDPVRRYRRPGRPGRGGVRVAAVGEAQEDLRGGVRRKAPDGRVERPWGPIGEPGLV